MPDYEQIVIGRGASALGFLYFAGQQGADSQKAFASKKTLVIGRKDLWAKISAEDPKHRFGQPAQIVTAPHKGKPETVNDPQFQTANTISNDLQDLERAITKRGGIEFATGDVNKVDRQGNELRVDVTILKAGVPSRKSLTARQVIVASGFGPSQLPPGVKLPPELSGGDWVRKAMGGTEYLYSSVKVPSTTPFVVAVQGSSATSSWAVLRALALGATHIYWISRSGFADANPAGRNSDVLKKASVWGWLTRAGVKAVAIEGAKLKLTLCRADAKVVPDKQMSDLGKAYKQWYQENKVSKAKNRQAELALNEVVINQDTDVIVDHYIYALGADPSRTGGAGDILSEGIKNTLSPVFDNDKRFGDVPGDTTVALKSDTGDVWVVGAAVFRSLGIKALNNIGDNFKNIAQVMSESGTPPEGIAAVMASLKAVTGYFETKKINFQTADFKEIELWVSDLYQRRTSKTISEKTKRGTTDQIVALRKHTVHGLSKDEIDNLNGSVFWDSLFTTDESGAYLIDRLAAFA